MKWLGILLALMILAGTVFWQVFDKVGQPRVGGSAGTSLSSSGAGAPSTLTDEIQAMKLDIENLTARIDGLDSRTSIGIGSANKTQPFVPALTPEAEEPEDDTLRDNFDRVVLIGARRSVNKELTVATPSFLRQSFGLPRQDLNDTCQSMTNPALREILKTEDVGPIRVTMLAPAVASLRGIFAQVQSFEPELYARIASSGSLCVRLIRGSRSSASAHAYGLALDINIDGTLDNFADGKTQLGLILMADFFAAEGWIWGAGFGREDSMHFEVSRQKIEEWRELGLL